MKKQINPTIKAHLIRAAFYLLLLLAVCAIPFALARPGLPSRSSAITVAEPGRHWIYERQSRGAACRCERSLEASFLRVKPTFGDMPIDDYSFKQSGDRRWKLSGLQ